MFLAARRCERSRTAGRSDFPLLSACNAVAEDIDDDLLRLIFTACHPVLPTEQRAALALRMLGGLSTPEIGRAFLVRKPPSASASCAPSGPCGMPALRSRRRVGKSGANASAPCLRWSI